MQNILKYILTWALAFIFLVSFTGMRLLIHHCMACESSDVYLFSQIDDCCEHQSHNHNHKNSCQLTVDETSSCCSANDTQTHCENCCKDEVLYVINEYDISLDRQQLKIELLEFQIASILLNELHGFDSSEYIFTPNNNFIPPPKWVGKDFILYSHQLKTDHISFQA
ncbi:MAG: hypothetical protein ABR597_08835 [Bacteroidales bacterium]